jgi:hypothetical protein
MGFFSFTNNRRTEVTPSLARTMTSQGVSFIDFSIAEIGPGNSGTPTLSAPVADGATVQAFVAFNCFDVSHTQETNITGTFGMTTIDIPFVVNVSGG